MASQMGLIVKAGSGRGVSRTHAIDEKSAGKVNAATR